MKISVVFPSVMYREGPEGVAKLIQGIEALGYDEIDMFDHVIMGYPTESRRAPFYSPTMPIMEAFMVLSYAAALTDNIGLGTGVRRTIHVEKSARRSGLCRLCCLTVSSHPGRYGVRLRKLISDEI